MEEARELFVNRITYGIGVHIPRAKVKVYYEDDKDEVQISISKSRIFVTVFINDFSKLVLYGIDSDSICRKVYKEFKAKVMEYYFVY